MNKLPALAGGSTCMGQALCVPVGRVPEASGMLLGVCFSAGILVPPGSGLIPCSPQCKHAGTHKHSMCTGNSHVHAQLLAPAFPSRCGPQKEVGASPETKTTVALWPARVNHITALLHLEKPGCLAAQNNITSFSISAAAWDTGPWQTRAGSSMSAALKLNNGSAPGQPVPPKAGAG